MNDQMFLLPKSLGDGIINYLASQPYKDVAGLVQGLQQLQALPQMPGNAVPLPEVDVKTE
jgi:hypothetical protein